MTGDADRGGSDLSHMREPKSAVHKFPVDWMFVAAHLGKYAIGFQNLLWRISPPQGGVIGDADVKFL